MEKVKKSMDSKGRTVWCRPETCPLHTKVDEVWTGVQGNECHSCSSFLEEYLDSTDAWQVKIRVKKDSGESIRVWRPKQASPGVILETRWKLKTQHVACHSMAHAMEVWEDLLEFYGPRLIGQVRSGEELIDL